MGSVCDGRTCLALPIRRAAKPVNRGRLGEDPPERVIREASDSESAASRRVGRRTPQPVAYLRARLLEGSPGPRDRRRSFASPPHPSRRAPRPGPPHWDHGKRANPWTRAAFASQGLWLRRHSTSGRNPRPSTLPETTLSSSVGSVVALLRHSLPAQCVRATVWGRTGPVNAGNPGEGLTGETGFPPCSW